MHLRKYQRTVKQRQDRFIELRLYMDCTPGDRKTARRALLREIKLLFERKHIKIPYNNMGVSDYRDEINTYIDTPDETPAEESVGTTPDADA